MIGICGKCGNHKWDKIVKEGRVICPECNHSWNYISLPLFILSGCSGVGKTTTGIELMQRQNDVVVLDADIFCGVQNASTEDDYRKRVDTIESLSRNISQSGKPVLWTMAGNLDMLPKSYNTRFFDGIYCLVLTVDEDALRDRMINGRGITDSGWIEDSVGYNQYLRTHNTLGELSYETLDITNKTPAEVADAVIEWYKKYL
jgi:broad-specificity NMP kinase